MRIQRVHYRRPFLNDPNPRVAMTMDASLMALGPAEPPLQIEIVFDPIERGSADEQPGEEADHHSGHVLVNPVPGAFEAIDQPLEFLLASRPLPLFGIEGRGDLLNLLDVLSDRRLLGSDLAQAAVDAIGQPVQLLLSEPPFFSSKLRWIESRTSSKASAIRKPGGWSGPPWSSLRMPRTAEQ